MTTLAQFSKNMRRRGRAVENSGSELVRRATLLMVKGAAGATPVDTGEARSNWRVGVGAPPSAIIPPWAPYPKGSKANGAGVGERANLNAVVNVARGRIGGVKGRSGIGLTTALYVVNNSPQIGFLNNGRSNQAPGGFIQAAFAEASAGIRGARLLD